MSKRKTKIEQGKFYYAYGGKMHPAQIFEYDKKHKTFKSFKFGTTKGRHMTEIHPLKDGSNLQFVNNRPFEGIREDYGDKELIGFVVDPRDELILTLIKSRPTQKTKRAKKRYKQ